MTKNFLRFLLLAPILLLPSLHPAQPASAALQSTGDEHWAGELTISGFDHSVNNLVSDGQGNVYAGGAFTAFGGEPVNHVARWDGSEWTGLGGGLEEQAHLLVADSQGNLYTDVLLTPEGGMPETVVMRWDGADWSELGGNLSALVDTLQEGRDSNILITDLVVDSQDRLYAGGFFYLVLPETEKYVSYVARWDGSGWELLGGMDHTVYQLAIDGQDNLYAAGEFSTAGGVPANHIAKWDGGTWHALGSGIRGSAPTFSDMVADENGNLYVTGQFEGVGETPAGLVARWDGAAWQDLAPGRNTGIEGVVAYFNDLAIRENGDLYAAGAFSEVDGVAANNIAYWDGASWKALSDEIGNGVNGQASAVAFDQQGRVFVGGYFTVAGGLPANHIARWDGATWFTWVEGGESGINQAVDALAAAPGGQLYAGGYFTTIGDLLVNYIAEWDGAGWKAMERGFDDSVHALALAPDGTLYAGGEFSSAGDKPVNSIARWDGSSWNPLGGGIASEHASTNIRALAVDEGGILYAGGDFTSAGGSAANYIARWDGSAWSPLGAGMDGQVTGLALDGQGNLYAAGWFTRAGNVEANGIARWDGSAWRGMGREVNTSEALAAGPDGSLYASGMFFLPPESSTFTHYLARWDGASWTPLGDGVDNFVHALAVDPEGNLYAAGDFLSVGGAPAVRIARWDGESWSPLGSGIGTQGDYSSIAVLAVDGAGNLYAGGQFTLAGSKPSAYLAKWCPELSDGGCSFSSGAAPELQVTPVLTETESPPLEMTPTALVDEPVPPVFPTPTDVPGTVAAPSSGFPAWFGVGVLLALAVVGLLFFVSRRGR